MMPGTSKLDITFGWIVSSQKQFFMECIISMHLHLHLLSFGMQVSGLHKTVIQGGFHIVKCGIVLSRSLYEG